MVAGTDALKKTAGTGALSTGSVYSVMTINRLRYKRPSAPLIHLIKGLKVGMFWRKKLALYYIAHVI